MTKPLIALLLIPLAGCVSFGGKPPKSMLVLSPASTVAVGTTRTAGAGQTVTILNPSPAAAIIAPRIPVYERGIAVAYVKDAVWVDAPSRLFQKLLSEIVAAKTGAIVLDLRQYTTDPGMRVQGSLPMFGIDGDKMEAVVTYDAIVQRGKGLETRRFESRVPVGVIDAANAGAALNKAANNVAVDVADWLK